MKQLVLIVFTVLMPITAAAEIRVNCHSFSKSGEAIEIHFAGPGTLASGSSDLLISTKGMVPLRIPARSLNRQTLIDRVEAHLHSVDAEGNEPAESLRAELTLELRGRGHFGDHLNGNGRLRLTRFPEEINGAKLKAEYALTQCTGTY